MAQHVDISWLSGRPASAADEDAWRAQAAAEAVLDAADVDYIAAMNDYRDQMEALDFADEAALTGLALVWAKAVSAANIALTEGWSGSAYSRDYVACELTAWTTDR